MLRTAFAWLVLTIFWPVGGGLAADSTADWPGWRGPNRDGKSPDRGLLHQWPDGGPKLLWKFDPIGHGYSSVAVVGGTVYTTGDQDEALVIFALGPDGKLQWQSEADKAYSRSHPGARATPTVDGGRLYLLSGNGAIGCFDAATGRKQWSRHTKEFGGSPSQWGYAESPLIYGELVIVKPGGKKCIVALDKATGRTVWTSSGFTAAPEYGSAILVTFEGRPMVIAPTRGGLVGVDARDGKLLWQNDFSANIIASCPTPAYAGGYVFWANGYGAGGICLRLKKQGDTIAAEQVWTTKDMVCHHGGYVIHDGYVYGNHSAGWACLELASGKKMWGERGVGKGSLCWADGMLYLFGEKGGQAALATCSPDGLRLCGRQQVEGEGTSWAHPVVIGGRLYLRYDTHLYCFDVARPGTSPLTAGH
ncbi:MAG: PQQ-binding-like beta-propeller repeat protein [Thermoguttaceae bacterium]|jgi:outer membrane protein assembly factor BamB